MSSRLESSCLKLPADKIAPRLSSQGCSAAVTQRAPPSPYQGYSISLQALLKSELVME